jgi:hypothetical protein
LNNRELIRYTCGGGLRMFDDECSVRWDGMDDEERADWLVFFDMCRDEPGPYTEDVIEAIAAGLCPHKAVVVRSGLGPWHGEPVEAPSERVWCFRSGERFNAATWAVPDPLSTFTHYLAHATAPWQPGGPLYCVPVEEVEGRWSTFFRRYAIPAFVFRHPAHAWSFLFSFL